MAQDRLTGDAPSPGQFPGSEEPPSGAMSDLRAFEFVFRQMLNSSPVGISVSHVRDGQIVDMNDEFLRILGFAREEVIGRTSHELHLWTAPDQRETIVREFREKGRFTPRAIAMRRKDGSLVDVLFSASALATGDEPQTIAWVMDITGQLRAEEQLRTSEERWRSLAENAPVVIITLDRDATVLSVNRSITGRPVGEYLGKTVFGFLHPDYREPGRAMVEAVLGGGPPATGEFPVIGPGGAPFWFQVSVALLSPSRPADGVILVATDIDKRRQAEVALKQSEGKWRSLVENAPAVITIIDRDGSVLSVNQTITRRPREEIVGHNAFSFLPADGRDQAREKVEGVFRTGIPATLRLPVYGPDGALRWFEHRLAPVFSDGEVTSVICLSTDINPQVLAEAALRESEQRFRDIVQSLGDWVWEVDTAGCLTNSSSQIEGLLGYTAEEMLGRSPSDTVVPEDRARYLAGIEALVRCPEPFRDLEIWHLHRDGQRVCLAVSGVPVFDAGGMLRGFRGVAHDVTDRLREEAEVQQARRVESLGVLAGGIAHDFNNLLTAILGNAELALAELPVGAGSRPLIAQIQSAGLHAAELTRQMLAYAGRGRFAIQPVDLTTAVREMSQLLGASIPKKVELVLNLADGLPAVEADPAQLRQLVMNLVINAAEAIGEGEGRISVRTVSGEPGDRFRSDFTLGKIEAGRQQVCVEIADSGHGIAQEAVARIFDPFFTTKFTGRGLGLAAVQGIVLRHGGTLAVSSAPGAGSTFRVCLPAGAPRTEQTPPPSLAAPGHAEAAGAWRGSGTILLVDDEAPVRSMAARMLQALGFQVLAAADGNEAVALVIGSPCPRAVLLDLTMPHMDGRETLRELRRLQAGLPVVLCSGYDVHESADRFADVGFNGFLQKPYRLDDLAQALRRALGE